MLKIFKKSFWIPYEARTVYPSLEQAQLAIAEYCVKNGHDYAFNEPEEVIIDGIPHEICRGYDHGTRGYGIKCREK